MLLFPFLLLAFLSYCSAPSNVTQTQGSNDPKQPQQHHYAAIECVCMYLVPCAYVWFFFVCVFVGRMPLPLPLDVPTDRPTDRASERTNEPVCASNNEKRVRRKESDLFLIGTMRHMCSIPNLHASNVSRSHTVHFVTLHSAGTWPISSYSGTEECG